MSAAEGTIAALFGGNANVAGIRKKLAEESSILEAPAFTMMVKPFAAGTISADRLANCTYRHVLAYLDGPDPVQEPPMTLMDWFSTRERVAALRAKKVSAREYACALVKHMNIVRAEDALLTPADNKVAAGASAEQTKEKDKEKDPMGPFNLIAQMEEDQTARSQPLCLHCQKETWWRSMYIVKFVGEAFKTPVKECDSVKNTIMEEEITDSVAAWKLTANAVCCPCVQELSK
jgi:hypothetical protein